MTDWPPPEWQPSADDIAFWKATAHPEGGYCLPTDDESEFDYAVGEMLYAETTIPVETFFELTNNWIEWHRQHGHPDAPHWTMIAFKLAIERATKRWIAEVEADAYDTINVFDQKKLTVVTKRVRRADAPPIPALAKRDPGAQRTEVTARVQVIREALGVGKSRAYEIEAEGTIHLEQRRILASAFAGDPLRNRPAFWERKNGKSRGRWNAGVKVFRDFIMESPDRFGGDDVAAAMATLARAYDVGTVPDHFKHSGELLATISRDRIAIDPLHTLALWDAFEAWRRR